MPEKMLHQLRLFEGGQTATIIGEITTAHPKQVVLTSAIGGKFGIRPKSCHF